MVPQTRTICKLTDPFLHNLQPNDKLYSATGVQLATTDPEKHFPVWLNAGRVSLELNDVADILVFSLCAALILTSLATKSPEDVSCFIATSDLGEVSGRFRESPTDDEQ